VTHGEVAVFDFENQAATYVPPGPRPGALPQLVLTESGLTITITLAGRFDIVANVEPGQTKPASWGLRSLDPFVDNTPPAGPFVVDFSLPVFGFTVDAGDYGQDADTITVQAFSGTGGTGTLVGSSSAGLPGGPAVFDFRTLTVAGIDPIRSVVLIGGETPGFNSMFFDNFRVALTPVPEPASATLLALGSLFLLGEGWRRQRRRAGR
jgi:hypothetical protein